MEELQKNAAVFPRSLPRREQLKDQHLAAVFCGVLAKTWVSVRDFPAIEEQRALTTCYEQGWLHSEFYTIIDPGKNPQVIGYSFASDLHRAFIEYILSDVTSSNFDGSSIMAFVLDICKSVPAWGILTPPPTGFPSETRSPEAQYAHAFYHACSKCANGNLVTLPDFGTSHGRRNFFIPSKGWGIEVLLNGNYLDDNALNKRFRPEGEYGRWMSAGTMKDFIMLDFCTAMPTRTHPGTCYITIYRVCSR